MTNRSSYAFVKFVKNFGPLAIAITDQYKVPFPLLIHTPPG